MRDGSLDVVGLARLDDDGVDAALTALPGIGPWTSTIYRLMVLCRPDAWPIHDIALAQAYADIHGLAVRPRPEEMNALAEGWRPVARGRGTDPVAPVPVRACGAPGGPAPLPYFFGARPNSRSLTIRCAAILPGAPITQPPGWVPEPHW